MGDNTDNSAPEIETDSWCRTTNGDFASTTFTWIIEDFLKRREKSGEPLASSTFTVSGPKDKVTTWVLETFPKGEEDEEDPDNDGVPLYIRNTGETSEEAKFSFSILNGRHQKVCTLKFSTEEYSKFSKNGKESAGFRAITTLEELEGNPDLLPGGSLTIVCDLTVYGSVATISGSKVPDEQLAPVDICGKEMNDQIGKLFGEKKFSDVKITCGEEVFDCHRNILSVRSPVFEAMFLSNMIENHSQNVVIKDIRPVVVKEMLHFIYNGTSSTEHVDQIAKDLLGAANQYQLELLKNKCEEKLCSSLDVGSSVELLVLADLHQAPKLRRMALSLVTRNMDTIVNTDVYKDFVAHHPVLGLQITQALVQKVGRKRENNND